MTDEMARLTLRVVDGAADAQELERLTAGLRRELLELDVLAAEPQTGEPPPGTRATLSFAVGSLVISLAGLDLLAAIVSAVTTWLQRDQNRSVRIGLGGDELELTGVPTSEQRRLTDEWLRRSRGHDRAPNGTRVALIVASDEYADPGLRRLRAPAQDAEALARVLGDPRIGGFEVRTMLNDSTQDVNEAVEEFFADRDPDDLLLLHFSGHGVKDESGELYFATPRTKLNRLGATAVSAEFVNRRMSRSRSRRIVLLLDCCYAGAFARGALPRAGLGVNVEEQFSGRGRVVITASNALEYAFDGVELADTQEMSPSVFTSALVEGLETGEADRDLDGYVGVDELFDHIYDAVRRSTPNQTPGKWTFDVRGDLHIAKRARPVSTPVALPQELQHAIDHPIAKIRAGAVEELARLRRSRHEGLARAARLALESLADDDSRLVSAAAAKAVGIGTDPPPPADTPPPVKHPPRPKLPPRTESTPSAESPPRKESPPRAESSPRAESPLPAESPSPAKAADTPVGSGTIPVEPAPPTEATPPARRPIPVSRASAVVGALVLIATSGIALISPIASIWLVLLVIAAVMVGLLPPGHRGRDVAVGAGFGLTAVYLGVVSESHYYSQMGVSLLGGRDPSIWWVAPAGGVLVLAAVMYEATSAAGGAWRPLDRTLAFLVLIWIIANVYFPSAVTEGPGESQLWLATVVLAGGCLLLTILHTIRHMRMGLPWVPMTLSVAATLLVTYDLVEIYHATTGRNVEATAYQPVLLVLLLVTAGSAWPRPYFAAAAKLSLIIGSLYGVAYYQPALWVMRSPVHSAETAPTQPGRLLVLLLAAALTMAAAYMSRPAPDRARTSGADVST